MTPFLESINPKKKSPVIHKILEKAKILQTPIIQEDAIQLMIQLIHIGQVTDILEIGTAIGYSSIMMALNSNANVYTIERDQANVALAKAFIQEANLEQRITVIHDDALTHQIPEDYQCDLLFIDAAKAQYVKFFEKYVPYVRQGGIIICDNLLFHGMVEHPENIESRNVKQLVRKITNFLDFLKENHAFDTQIYHIGDGLSISIKK